MGKSLSHRVMPSNFTKPGWQRSPFMLLAFGLAVTAAAPVQVLAKAKPATAPVQSKHLQGMSPLDVLVVEDQIRQRYADYSLMFDGDGVSNQTAAWADDIFTKDVKWRWYDADGKLRMAANGRAELQQAPRTGRTQSSAKHLPIVIKFDDITPTRVKTRSVITLLDVPAAKSTGQPDGVPNAGAPAMPTTLMIVYHDTWVKSEGKWKKAITVLHSATYSGGYNSTPSCPMPAGTAPGCASVRD